MPKNIATKQREKPAQYEGIFKLKKIVFILPSIKTGGGNRVIIELANKLVEKNLAIDILYPNNSSNLNTFTVSRKINFIPIGIYKKSKFHKIFNLLKIFYHINKAYTNEFFIFTDPIMSIFIPFVDNNKKIYRFIQADDYTIFNDLHILKNYLLLIFYQKLTKFSYTYKIEHLFNSCFTFRSFQENSLRSDVPCSIVHPAINHDVFFNQNIRPIQHINICIIARKHPLKGFIDFLNAIQNIKNLITIHNIYVISHDDLSDFDLSNIQLVNPKNDNDIAYYMNLSHIFISPSWREGFGLPSLEAMACGCSVILTNAGGVEEYAVPYKNCLIYEPKKVHELEECLIQLIKNSELRNYLSQNALETAQNFTWEKSTLQLLKALND